MARQLILLSCLAALVFSAQNCYPSGPAIGNRCPNTDFKLIGGSCYKCTTGDLKNCVSAGPAIGGMCPSYDMVIQFGLGKSVDPNNVGICAKCPASG